MRVLGLVAALVLLSTLPPVSAQAPDPGEVVDLACATVGGVEPRARELLPVCPRVDPAGPSPAAEEEAASPAPAPATPQDVGALVDEVVEDAQAIPQDPGSAPSRLLSILATVVQFVRDALGLPLQAFAAMGGALQEAAGALDEARASAFDAIAGASDALREAASGVVERVRALFDAPGAPDASRAAPRAKLPRPVPAADGLLAEVSGLVPA